MEAGPPLPIRAILTARSLRQSQEQPGIVVRRLEGTHPVAIKEICLVQVPGKEKFILGANPANDIQLDSLDAHWVNQRHMSLHFDSESSAIYIENYSPAWFTLAPSHGTKPAQSFKRGEVCEAAPGSWILRAGHGLDITLRVFHGNEDPEANTHCTVQTVKSRTVRQAPSARPSGSKCSKQDRKSAPTAATVRGSRASVDGTQSQGNDLARLTVLLTELSRRHDYQQSLFTIAGAGKASVSQPKPKASQREQ